MSPLDLLLAVSVPVIWGTGFTLAKAGFAQFPPILLMALRFTLAALVLVWFVKPPWPLMRRIFVIAIISATIQYSLTFTGLAGLDASTAVLVVQLEVPFAALLAWLLFRDRLGWRRALGMVLAFVGLLVIAGEPRLEGHYTSLFLVMSGALTWAFGQVLIKTMGRVGGFTLIAWVAVFAAPQLYVCSLLFEEGQVQAIAAADWRGWGVVLYLGLVMTALGYAIWYHLLGKYAVTQVMPFLLLLPVTSVLWGVLLLGETLTPTIVVGGVIILFGVAGIILQQQPRPRPVDHFGD